MKNKKDESNKNLEKEAYAVEKIDTAEGNYNISLCRSSKPSRNEEKREKISPIH